MVDIRIEPSQVKHVRELQNCLRDKDQIEARSMGLDPQKALFFAYRQSILRETAFVDGKVAAMWGVCGTPLGIVGRPYLITGREVEKVSSFTFARIYKNSVRTMSSVFPVLENYVDASYTEAVRMLRIAGFSLSEPVLINTFPFLRFTLRTA